MAGLVSNRKNWNGTLCLPGTHSKWVQVADNQVTAFQTYMTGELFAVCKRATVLQHSVRTDAFSIDVFEETVKNILQHPEHAAAQVFTVRAKDLLAPTVPADAGSRLSGILIAMELASIRAKWTFDTVTLVGDPALCQRYRQALRLTGVSTETADAKALTIAGLTAARHSHVIA